MKTKPTATATSKKKISRPTKRTKGTPTKDVVDAPPKRRRAALLTEPEPFATPRWVATVHFQPGAALELPTEVHLYAAGALQAPCGAPLGVAYRKEATTTTRCAVCAATGAVNLPPAIPLEIAP